MVDQDKTQDQHKLLALRLATMRSTASKTTGSSNEFSSQSGSTVDFSRKSSVSFWKKVKFKAYTVGSDEGMDLMEADHKSLCRNSLGASAPRTTYVLILNALCDT